MAIASAVLLSTLDASAFCRTTTIAVPADFQPRGDNCWTQGQPLFWKNACVGYSLQQSASRQVSYADAANVAAKAFTRWSGASCPGGGGTSRASIDVRDLGPVSCGLVAYNQDYGNQHVVVFRDDGWPHNDGVNTLALTTVTFNPDTGEIYDADMEVNTFGQKVTVSDPVPRDGYDFASIMTHEAGHFLGLAHSGDSRATMYANYQPGNTAMRELTADDVAGICTIYRPDGNRLMGGNKTTPQEACDPTPRHGFARDCKPAQKSGCSSSTIASHVDAQPWAGLAALGACVGVAALRRRRRAR
jgi:hypothetical protein